jgi:hypothetical protein
MQQLREHAIHLGYVAGVEGDCHVEPVVAARQGARFFTASRSGSFFKRRFTLASGFLTVIKVPHHRINFASPDMAIVRYAA